MAKVIKTIQNFAFSNNLWEKNSKIIVGVSGGSDSVCLLDILSKLATKYNFEIHVAHVNYGLRGKDSEQDELFVKKLAQKYGFPFSVLTPKKSACKGNLESSLRKIRYDFFQELCEKQCFDLVAVAHNQDDQAETVLMRILRGSGLNGLSAMKAKSGNVIRPLLQTNKPTILAYLKENKLKYRTDKSNSDPKFTRNKTRHGLLPYLEKNFNPAIKKSLSEWSLIVASDYDFIAQNAQFFRAADCKNKCVHFNSEEFLELHEAMQRQELRNLFFKFKNTVEDLESGQIEEILKVIKSNKSKVQKAVIGGLKISKKGVRIEIFC